MWHEVGQGLVGLDYGTVPEWLAAVGTVGALWFAVVQGRAARRDAAHALAVANREAQLREEVRQDDEAAQARLLSITSTHTSEGAIFHIKNHSEQPYFGVRVEAAYYPVPFAPANYSWEHWPNYMGSNLKWPVLAPGASVNSAIRYRDDASDLMTTIQRDVTLDVSYVDARGVRWRRFGNAHPRRDQHSATHREPPPPPPRYQPDES